MTLLIAQRDRLNVFMTADSAITGGALDERQREYALKIVPSLDGRALIGYAGDHHHGMRLAYRASSLPAGVNGLKFLSQAQRDYPSVDFAYAFADDAGCHLFRIAVGKVEDLQAFHLGSAEAFDHFQRVRHAQEIDPAPEAIKTIIVASRASDAIPDTLSNSIASLLRVFAERTEHDVGGWVTAYFLTKDGAFLCGYGYSVSDPILTKIGPGSAVPHGTVQAGGFGLSVTELGEREGLVVYWLQLPGGTIFVRTSENYTEHSFQGTPSDFVASASERLGRKVEIWFGDKPTGQPQTITVIRDRNGVPAMAIANDRGTLSFAVLNVATPFDARAAMDFSTTSDLDSLMTALESDQVRLTFDSDRKTTTLNLVVEKQPATKIVLGPRELDTLIAHLGEARARLQESVPFQPPHSQPGVPVRDLMVLNPAWRTEAPVHPSLNGITLRLRHPGFGWLTFLLPWHEVKNLGEWLTRNSSPPQSP
jgi:hypothetical protein